MAERRLHSSLRILFIFILPAFIFSGSFSLFGEDSRPDLHFSAGIFSPHHTGPNDRLIITPGKIVRRSGDLQDWVIEIKDASGSVVKTIRADKRKTAVSTSGGTPYAPESFRTAPLEIFDEIVWDGRSDRGELLPAGEYTVTGWYLKTGRRTPVRLKEYNVRIINSMFVSSLIPERSRIVLELPSETSLQGDVPGTFLLRNQTADPWQYSYSASVLNDRGNLIKKYKWKEYPPYLEWDGKSGDEFAAPGVYSLVMTLTDAAGNSATVSYNDLAVVSRETLLGMQCDSLYFSTRSAMQCSPAPFPEDFRFLRDWQKKLNIREWKAEIRSGSSGRTVRSFYGKDLIPERITWDGTDSGHRIMPDGIYSITFTAVTESGEIQTPARPVILDNTQPSVLFFSAPDSYDADEYIKFRIKASDAGRIRSWSLRIFLLSPESSMEGRQLFRSFSGNGEPPFSVHWYGDTDNGIPAESGETYQAELTLTDEAGNQSTVLSDTIHTEVIFRLIRSDAADLRMILPSSGLFTENDELTPEGTESLKKVSETLKLYPAYRINIYSAMSSEKENKKELLLRTEKRAFAVYTYLKNRGVPPARMKYQGSGATEPADQTYQSRNNRIQIDLTLP